MSGRLPSLPLPDDLQDEPSPPPAKPGAAPRRGRLADRLRLARPTRGQAPQRASGPVGDPGPQAPPGGAWGAPPRRLLPDLFAVAFLTLCAAVLHRDALLAGSVFFEDDTVAFYYPLTAWFAEQLRAGRLPLWFPGSFSGYPLFADGEIGMLYPLNLLLFRLLPVDRAFVLSRALHPFIAAVGMYAFLRTLRLGPFGATIGGLVFAFGSFFSAQLHHENVVRTAVWLPLVLVPLELALRARDWRFHAGLIVAGVVLAVALLGLHVQPAVMVILAVQGYAALRGLGPPLRPALDSRGDGAQRSPTDGRGPRRDGSSAGASWRLRLLRYLWPLVVVPGTALLLVAVQWGPLFELGWTSFRGRGVAYEFATAFAIAPANLLPSLLFPYFFRGPDGIWWTLWAPWETIVYVGIAPLLLAVFGLLAGPGHPGARGAGALWARLWPTLQLRVYFLGIALFGLLVALASDAPLNLHELLWSLPGFSSLRAPGRFSYLFVFGVAGLAAIGADRLAGSLDRPLGRPARGLLAALALLAGLGAVGLSAELVSLRAWLLANPAAALDWIEATYLTLRRQEFEPTPAVVYRGLAHALDLGNPKTALTLALLAATAVALGGLAGLGTPSVPEGAWGALALRRGRRTLWLGLLGGLVAADLLVFAYDFHPQRPLPELMAPAPPLRFLAERDPGARVFVAPQLTGLRPNRPAAAGLRGLNGYSSLQPQRHADYADQVNRQDDALLDLWGARYVVLPAEPTTVRAWGVAFDPPYHPLAAGPALNPTSYAALSAPGEPVRAVRLIGTLSHAFPIPDGTVVAELTLTDATGERVTLPVRAGEHLAEWAADRPDVRPLVQHRRPPVAFAFVELGPNGEPYPALLYVADLPLDRPRAVTRVEFRYVSPTGEGLLYGLGLVREDGSVRSLTRRDRAKYRPVYEDGAVVVLENQNAYPRAFLVPDVLRQGDYPTQAALPQMTLRPFDPARTAVIDGWPPGPRTTDPGWHSPSHPQPALEVREVTPEEVIVRVEPAPERRWLVLTDLTHRGWRAYVDGRWEPVWIADYLFRAVWLPAGAQEVRFVFDPLSLQIGRFFSIGGVVYVVLALLLLPHVGRWWARWRQRRGAR